ncbi:MAG: RNA-guided endonuclease InsQ/TnpB family protein [Acidimicrobiia bacterium]
MAWRYRLYPTPAAEEVLVRHCGDARLVWNLALEQANHWRPGRRPGPGSPERFRQLAEARRAFPWLGAGSSSVQQQALRDFDQALRNWWAGTHRRPRWRKQGVDEGFCVRDVSVGRLSRKWAEILVPKCGAVRFRLSRPLGPHGMARITKDRAGRWHVAFSAPQPSVARRSTGTVVGVDLGVANTLTTSDGDHLHIPGWRPSEERRLVHLQRKLARQQQGSRRRARTKHALAVLYARAADRRWDWAEKTSTDLVRRYDLVAFEDLGVKDMLRSARGTRATPGRNVAAKAALNQRIAAAAWSTLVRRTRQKAEASDAVVVLVDPRHTSQTCSACGHVAAENRPTQAVFACQACGHGEHADTNAAKNIRARGLRVPARGGRPEVGAPSETRTTRQEAA